MFVNLTSLEEGAHAEFCVIGSGPAGMTVARKLAAAGRKVFLFEGGGEEISEESQNIYKGKIVKGNYHPVDSSRLRFLGGSSNHWGGSCMNFEDYDFKPKKGSPLSGWPIDGRDLAPYVVEASETLDVKPVPLSDPLLFDGFQDLVQNKYSNGLYPDPQQTKHALYLKKSQHLSVFLNSNLISLDTDGARVTSAIFSNYENKRRTVRADFYILATGGIENNRILLYNNLRSQGKLVSDSRSLGKYYMDHPLQLNTGRIIFWLPKVNWETPFELFAPQKNLLDQYGILSFTCLKYTRNSEEILNDLKNEIKLKGFLSTSSTHPLSYGRLFVFPEQEPQANNSISLGDDVDRFGIPRIEVSISLSDLYYRTVRIASLIFAQYMIDRNYGRAKVYDYILNEEPSLNLGDGSFSWGNHHMGGTRMAETSELGIVDKNCLVFGQKNLYIAGSSVFPSGGCNTPTYTIVQLALRLSDHLLALRA